KKLGGHFGICHVIYSCDQMTMVAPACPSFYTSPAVEHLSQVIFSEQRNNQHGGASVESGFEPLALWLQTETLRLGYPDLT
ncbi:hypothetical protein AVEN_183497-1, partial [Araneus ventricosus]